MSGVADMAWVGSLTQELLHAMGEAKKKKKKKSLVKGQLTKAWTVCWHIKKGG